MTSMSEHPGRPDHPDFRLIAQVVTEIDAQAASGEDAPDIIGRIVDQESASYSAEHRGLRAARLLGLPQEAAAVIAGAWLDGFVAGARFQHLKTSGTQLPEDDKVPE